MDTAEQDIPSNPTSEMLLARGSLYRNHDTGISTVTWPDVSSKTLLSLLLYSFHGNKPPRCLTDRGCFQRLSKDLHALLDTSPV